MCYPPAYCYAYDYSLATNVNGGVGSSNYCRDGFGNYGPCTYEGAGIDTISVGVVEFVTAGLGGVNVAICPYNSIVTNVYPCTYAGQTL